MIIGCFSLSAAGREAGHISKGPFCCYFTLGVCVNKGSVSFLDHRCKEIHYCRQENNGIRIEGKCSSVQPSLARVSYPT